MKGINQANIYIFESHKWGKCLWEMSEWREEDFLISSSEIDKTHEEFLLKFNRDYFIRGIFTRTMLCAENKTREKFWMSGRGFSMIPSWRSTSFDYGNVFQCARECVWWVSSGHESMHEKCRKMREEKVDWKWNVHAWFMGMSWRQQKANKKIMSKIFFMLSEFPQWSHSGSHLLSSRATHSPRAWRFASLACHDNPLGSSSADRACTFDR